jgi:(p)ppGpp synthase/HD superfamily hydrolase
LTKLDIDELIYNGLRSFNKYITKKQDGCFQKVAITPSEYFGVISEDKNTAILQLPDRVNNLQSMQRGKFTLEKQRKYVEEVKTYFLPMAKRVRLANPEYMDAFYNLETMLKFQIEFVEMFIDASQTND